MARKRKSGHFCWCCERSLPNERFSGSGHARHICRECARLHKGELEYRQGVRNVQRMLGWSELIPKRKRAAIESLLTHPNERVQRYVTELLADDARRRAESRLLDDGDIGFET